MSGAVRILVTVLLGALTVGGMWGGCSGSMQEVPTAGSGSPPAITASFSPAELSRNDTWKVYIAANDPDGDMFEAVATLNQSGYGYHGASPFRIKKEHRAAMVGYFLVHNRSGGFWLSDGSWMELSVYITDRAGNKSKTVVLPVVFTVGTRREHPPAPFNTAEMDQVGSFWFEVTDPLREMQRGLRMR